MVEWGEMPSSFFLNLERRAALDKCISSLVDDNGDHIDNQMGIMDTCYNYYKSPYSSHGLFEKSGIRRSLLDF